MLAIGALSAQPTWTLIEEARIGAISGPQALTVVSAVLPLQSTVIVAQPHDYELRMFDIRTGNPVRTLGGRGRGPGEFDGVGPGRLGWDGTSITAADMGRGRMISYSPNGEHIETKQFLFTKVAGSHAISPVRATPDGMYWAEPGYTNVMAVANGVISSIALRIVSQDGRIARVIADLPIQNLAVSVHYGTGGAVFQKPLTPWPLWEYDPHGGWIVIVDPRPDGDGSSGRFRVTKISSAGDTVYDKTFPSRQQRVPTSTRDSLYRVYAGMFQRGNTASKALQLAKKSVVLPDFFPTITALVSTSAGDVWLRRGAPIPRGNSWLVLDANGALRANVRAPAELKILAVEHGRVWGTAEHESGMPLLIRYRIVNSSN